MNIKKTFHEATFYYIIIFKEFSIFKIMLDGYFQRYYVEMS